MTLRYRGLTVGPIPISGLAGFLWCCLFVFYARNSPGEMPGITQIEKDYIEKSLGVYGQTEEDRRKSRVSLMRQTSFLTLKAPITTAADDIHKYFSIVFQRK